MEVAISVLLAVALSIWSLSRLIPIFTSKLWGSGLKDSSIERRKIASYIVSALISPIALFLGFVVGGNLGGGWGEVLLGRPGIFIGLGVGIYAVMTLVFSVVVIIGIGILKVIEKSST